MKKTIKTSCDKVAEWSGVVWRKQSKTNRYTDRKFKIWMFLHSKWL